MITFDSNNNIFYSTKINNDRFFSGFGTKQLGDGRETVSIFDFFDNNKTIFQKIVMLGQIHSSNVKFYSSALSDILPGFNINVVNQDKIPDKIEDTDGIITRDQLIVLTVQTADCLPIIFCDKKSGLIGISHQGWRGSLKRLPQKMVEKIVENGGNKDSIVVSIGPGIGQCCYDIDDDHYYTFLEEFDGFSEKIFQVKKGRRFLNLTLLNYLLLKDIGIKKTNIDFFPFCTYCDKNRFFSFRRDKKSYKEMFSFVVKLK